MNNPFGLPDDVFEAIIASAAKQAMNGRTPIQPKAFTSLQEQGAKAAKEIYDSYVKIGFTEAQAFGLLKCVLTKK